MPRYKVQFNEDFHSTEVTSQDHKSKTLTADYYVQQKLADLSADPSAWFRSLTPAQKRRIKPAFDRYMRARKSEKKQPILFRTIGHRSRWWTGTPVKRDRPHKHIQELLEKQRLAEILSFAALVTTPIVPRSEPKGNSASISGMSTEEDGKDSVDSCTLYENRLTNNNRGAGDYEDAELTNEVKEERDINKDDESDESFDEKEAEDE